MTFTDLKLATPLLTALNDLGYLKPTPVQEKTIPLILGGKDLFGCAQTGTGKTAAFVLPLLQKISESKKINPAGFPRALILAPTRELASQIYESILLLGKYARVSSTLVFGGVSQKKQVQELKKGVEILVATPGRLLDLMQQGYIHAGEIEYFVLDEADKMLDMGFINDIKRILLKLPASRQTLFFSATTTPPVNKLVASILDHPVSVQVDPVSSVAPLIEQKVYFVDRSRKRQLLNYVLKSENADHALVFTRTKRGADKVTRELKKNGMKAEAIHGNKSQSAREKVLAGFKEKSIRILVATDIASRGIDIEKLSLVINYEMPEQAETYVHRIGRTGRAGQTGKALSFCTAEDKNTLNSISKLIRGSLDIVNQHPYM